ncbi:AAA family ATPase [Paraburkholderia diazotrophica]|uniref:AAA family ATPase n=1 Tax=Paraburkholderia diazotrophica TaxID=667676 RepID=UPI00317220E2
MMPVYLSRIELSEFRGFKKLAVDLHTGPGVLLVHGANGLGKSSLFDAIEWALTNRINQFPESKGAIEQGYLRRWNAPEDRPTEIALRFNDEHLIRRRLVGLDTTGVTDVTSFLQSPAWRKEIKHLERYLSLTHFLGQSTLTRLTHRDAKERWDYLAEPAQSQRATDIAKALHGHGASLPARAFERQMAELKRNVDELERMLSLEDEQWEAARLDGALSEEMSMVEALVLRDALTAIGVQLNLSLRPEGSLTHDTLSDDLSALGTLVEEGIRLRAVAIERGRVLDGERQRINVGIAAVDGAIDAAGQVSDAIRQARIATAERLEQARGKLDEQTRHHVKAQEAIAALLRFEEACEKAAGLRETRPTLESNLGLATETLRKAEDERKRSERRKALADRLNARGLQCRNEVGTLSQRLKLIGDAEDASRVRQTVLSKAEVFDRENLGLQEQIEKARSKQKRESAELAQLTENLNRARSSYDELAGAVATIAANLAEDACKCPVCATKLELQTNC